MFNEYLKVAVAGSVDHGKSTLIGRLLYDLDLIPQELLDNVMQVSENGNEQIDFMFLLDQLKEEREKKITIDTSQVFLCDQGREYVLIDNPGHQEFIKNMITGSSQASAGILLVDIEQGFCPQTLRHVLLLELLGIRQVIVVVNKMDKVNFNEQKFRNLTLRIKGLFNNVGLDDIAMIPVSALNGDNIYKPSARVNWYGGPTVVGALNLIKEPNQNDNLPLRIPIQDIYEIDGKKQILGTILSGRINVCDIIKITSSEERRQVRSIQSLGKEVTTAGAGECVSLSLSEGCDLQRGQIISETTRPLQRGNLIQCKIYWMNDRSLKAGDHLTLRIATQKKKCYVEAITNRLDSGSCQIIKKKSSEINNSEIANVQIFCPDRLYFDDFNLIPPMGRLVFFKGRKISAVGRIL